MRFIPFGTDKDHDATRARISRYMEHERKHGFSKWIVIARDSGCPIGDAGFFRMPDGERVELGYRFDRRYWGQGLATEVASKWLEIAQSWYGLEQVFAFAHPNNAASSRILKKLGFRFSLPETLYGMVVPVYVINLGDAQSPS
jgi:ribosomal-protein-alanine N-acetyltransferase